MIMLRLPGAPSGQLSLRASIDRHEEGRGRDGRWAALIIIHISLPMHIDMGDSGHAPHDDARDTFIFAMMLYIIIARAAKKKMKLSSFYFDDMLAFRLLDFGKYRARKMRNAGHFSPSRIGRRHTAAFRFEKRRVVSPHWPSKDFTFFFRCRKANTSLQRPARAGALLQHITA